MTLPGAGRLRTYFIRNFYIYLLLLLATPSTTYMQDHVTDVTIPAQVGDAASFVIVQLVTNLVTRVT